MDVRLSNFVPSLSEDARIEDADGKIWAVQLGRLEGWDKVWDRVDVAVEQLQSDLEGLGVCPHRRGDFVAYAVGFSFGGGPTVSRLLASGGCV